MVREMCLVSPEQFKRCSGVKTEKNYKKEHDYDKWIKMSKNIREQGFTRKAQTKDVANFLKQVLPTNPTVLAKKIKKIFFESREHTPPVNRSVARNLFSQSKPFTSPRLKELNSKLVYTMIMMMMTP